jgi:hypothetical protein
MLVSTTATLVYDIRLVAGVSQVEGGLQIAFGDGTVALLDACHPNFDVLRIHAQANQGRPVPVGVVLDGAGQIVDLNTAHDTAVQSVQDCLDDHHRVKVAFWGYSPVCYLTRDHPEFERIQATLTKAVGTQAAVWVANHSTMIEDAPAADDSEVEIWWKIMDVRAI